MVVSYAIFPSSLCNIAVLAMDGKLFELKLLEQDVVSIRKKVLARFPDAKADECNFKKLRILIEKYFEGERVDFDVDIILPFSSSFTKNVLAETRRIPYGEIRTYGWLAERIGCKKAARAVGQALKRNPIPLVIPCHRVIGRDGHIRGFSSGIHIKRRLLEIEGITTERLKG